VRADYEFRNPNGYDFVDFIYVTEDKLEHFCPLSGSFAVIKCESKFLMGYNSLRRQWSNQLKREKRVKHQMITLWDLEEKIGRVDALDMRILECMTGSR
jgi:hypothetical protein